VRYISLGEWFDKGTEAELVDDYRPKMGAGLFRGIRNGKPDEEVCTFDEFEVDTGGCDGQEEVRRTG